MAGISESVTLTIQASVKGADGAIAQVRRLDEAVAAAARSIAGRLTGALNFGRPAVEFISQAARQTQSLASGLDALRNRAAAVFSPIPAAGASALQVFGRLGSALSGFVLTAQTAMGALSAVGGALAAAANEGLRFTRALETTELSIRSLVANQLLASGAVRDVGEAFRIAGEVGADQLRKLKLAAIDTSVSFEALSGAFQEALGTGLSRGFTPDQIRRLTLQIGQMGAALGMPGYQLPQEIRAILSGQIDRNARVGLALFNTEEERKKLQELLNTDVNAAFSFIESKLQAVTVGGQMASRTFEGLLGNARESLTLFASIGTGTLFAGLKQALAQVQDSIIIITRDTATGAAESVKLTPPFERLAELVNALGAAFSRVLLNAITYVQSALERVGRVLENNPDLVKQLAAEFEAVLESVLDIGRAVIEGLRLDQPKDAAQGLIYILEGVRLLLGGIASLAGAVAVAFRLHAAMIDAVRNGLIFVTQGAASFADALSAGLGVLAQLVSFSASLEGYVRAAAGAAAGLAASLRGAASGLRSIGAQMGGVRGAEAKADLTGAAAPVMPRAPRAAGGGGGGRGRGVPAGDDPVLQALERRRAAAARVERLMEADAERRYRLERARIADATDELRDAYERKLLAAEDYYRRLAALQSEAAENERRRAQDAQAREFARMQAAIADRAEAQRIRDPRRREQELRRLADEESQAQARLIDATTRLAEIESERGAERRRLARESEEAYRAEQRAIQELQAALIEAEGDRAAIERLRIEREYLDTVRQIHPALVQAVAAIGDLEEAEKARAALIAGLTEGQREQLALAERLRAKRLEQLAVDEAVAEAGRAINEVKREQAQLAERMRLAGFTDAEIQQAVNAVYERRRAVIEGLIERARAAADALPTQENVEALRGLSDATRDLVSVSADAGAQIRQNLAASLEGLFAGLITNARNAGEAFKRFAMSVVQSIAQIIARMLVLRLLQGALGGFFGKIGLGGVLPGAGGALIPGKAGGGTVAANRPYIVGERGPELFVPSVGGNIIPAEKMRVEASRPPGETPGGGVRIVNNIDPSVFDDHLYGVAGERIVINHIRNNRARISQLLRTA